MIAVLAAMAGATGAGAWVDLRFGARAEHLTKRLMDLILWVAMPFIVFLTIARLHLDADVGLGLALGLADRPVAAALGWLVVRHVLGRSRAVAGVVAVGVLISNTGYLGIPLTAAVLGRDALPAAVAWDTVLSSSVFLVAAFAVGAAIAPAAGASRARRTLRFLRNPALVALTAGLLAPDALAPDALVSVAEVAAFGLLPVAFFVLGLNLRGVPALDRAVAAAIGLRLGVAPAVYAALVAVAGLHVPDAYRLQSAMPCGINTLIVAHASGLDLRTAAGAVFWSTAIMVPVAVVVV